MPAAWPSSGVGPCSISRPIRNRNSTPEHEVQAREADQGEEHGAGVHHGTGAVGRSHQAVHEPGLPPELCGHPSGVVAM